MALINLKVATVFPDLNKKEGKDASYARNEIELNTLKYKHFRSVMQHPEADQMHHLMMAITSLSEDDIGELSPADAATVSGIVFDSMKEYMQLGQKIVGKISGQ